MNRRQLLLGSGALLVGEPVRRAYSFLNGSGIDGDMTLVACIGGHSFFANERLCSVIYAARFTGSLDEFLRASDVLDAHARAVYGVPGALGLAGYGR